MKALAVLILVLASGCAMLEPGPDGVTPAEKAAPVAAEGVKAFIPDEYGGMVDLLGQLAILIFGAMGANKVRKKLVASKPGKVFGEPPTPPATG